MTERSRPHYIITTTVFDKARNPIETISPLGEITTQLYDAQEEVTETIDARGFIATTLYNADREVTEMVTIVCDAYRNRIEEDVWVSGSGTMVTRFGVDGWNTTQPAPVGNENFNDVVDLNGSNALVDRRMFGAGVDQPVVREDASGNVGWYLTDELGNVVGLTNGSGTPLTTIAYDGFGDVLTNSTPAQSDRYLMAGSQWDGALGLRVNDQRVTNGKFWYQPDPIWPMGDPTNPYRVVGNDLMNATDPSGLQPVPLTPQTAPKMPAKMPGSPNGLEDVKPLVPWWMPGASLNPGVPGFI